MIFNIFQSNFHEKTLKVFNTTILQLPSNICVRSKQELLDYIFPKLNDPNENIDATDFDDRAILSTCNDAIDQINDLIIGIIEKKLCKKHSKYLSVDSIKEIQCLFSSHFAYFAVILQFNICIQSKSCTT